MAVVKEAAQGVYHIRPAAETRVPSCAVFLVTGERPAVVESGPAIMADHIIEGIKQVGVDPSTIAYVIPTHIHLDHGGGAGYLMQKLPNSRLVVHALGAPHMIDPTRLIASTKLAFGEHFQQTHGPMLPVPAERVWAVKGGEEVDLGGRTLSVIDTPGHAPHHICLLDSTTRGIFSGEALGSYRPGSNHVYPSIAPPAHNQELYLESIKKLLALAPPVIFFSHDGAGVGLDDKVRRLEEAVKEFEALVLAAMREGAAREEIEKRVANLYREHALRNHYRDDRWERTAFLLTGGMTIYLKRKGLAL